MLCNVAKHLELRKFSVDWEQSASIKLKDKNSDNEARREFGAWPESNLIRRLSGFFVSLYQHEKYWVTWSFVRCVCSRIDIFAQSGFLYIFSFEFEHKTTLLLLFLLQRSRRRFWYEQMFMPAMKWLEMWSRHLFRSIKKPTWILVNSDIIRRQYTPILTKLSPHTNNNNHE